MDRPNRKQFMGCSLICIGLTLLSPAASADDTALDCEKGLVPAATNLNTPDFNSSDPYEVLGIRAGANRQQIKGAYYALMRRHHPNSRPNGDLAADPAADQRVSRIIDAYKTLEARSDEELNISEMSLASILEFVKYRSPPRPRSFTELLSWTFYASQEEREAEQKNTRFFEVATPYIARKLRELDHTGLHEIDVFFTALLKDEKFLNTSEGSDRFFNAFFSIPESTALSSVISRALINANTEFAPWLPSVLLAHLTGKPAWITTRSVQLTLLKILMFPASNGSYGQTPEEFALTSWVTAIKENPGPWKALYKEDAFFKAEIDSTVLYYVKTGAVKKELYDSWLQMVDIPTMGPTQMTNLLSLVRLNFYPAGVTFILRNAASFAPRPLQSLLEAMRDRILSYRDQRAQKEDAVWLVEQISKSALANLEGGAELVMEILGSDPLDRVPTIKYEIFNKLFLKPSWTTGPLASNIMRELLQNETFMKALANASNNWRNDLWARLNNFAENAQAPELLFQVFHVIKNFRCEWGNDYSHWTNRFYLIASTTLGPEYGTWLNHPRIGDFIEALLLHPEAPRGLIEAYVNHPTLSAHPHRQRWLEALALPPAGRARLVQIKSIDMLPRLDESAFIESNDPLEPVPGLRRVRLRHGTYKNYEVLVKEVWSPEAATREASMALALQSGGVNAQRFLGVIVKPGQPAQLVMSFTRKPAFVNVFALRATPPTAAHLALDMSPANPRVTDKVYSQMKAVGERLGQAGIYAHELQFIIDTVWQTVELANLGNLEFRSPVTEHGERPVEELATEAAVLLRGHIERR